MSGSRNRGSSAKEEAVAIAVRCRGGVAPSRSASVAKSAVVAKLAVLTNRRDRNRQDAVAAGTVAALPRAAEAAPPKLLDGMGLTTDDASKLAFLGRYGAIPPRSALGTMPSQADFKAAAPPAIAGYTEDETATLAMLSRAGFGPSRAANEPGQGNEDGLTAEETATLALVKRAGFGSSANAATSKGFRR